MQPLAFVSMVGIATLFACAPASAERIRQTYQNGNLKAEYDQDADGTMNGEYRLFYENGTAKTKGYYTHGAKSGTWSYFDKDGGLISTEEIGNPERTETVGRSAQPADSAEPGAKTNAARVIVSVDSDRRGSDEEYTIPELENKVTRYTSMRNAGLGLLGSGGGLLAFGVCFFAAGISSTTEDGAMPAMLGAVMVEFGIPLTIAGIVVSSIGGHKVNEYTGRLSTAKGHVYLKAGLNRLQLVYDF
jgi:hypothetical protein